MREVCAARKVVLEPGSVRGAARLQWQWRSGERHPCHICKRHALCIRGGVLVRVCGGAVRQLPSQPTPRLVACRGLLMRAGVSKATFGLGLHGPFPRAHLLVVVPVKPFDDSREADDQMPFASARTPRGEYA